jgi:hypothetical protein
MFASFAYMIQKMLQLEEKSKDCFLNGSTDKASWDLVNQWSKFGLEIKITAAKLFLMTIACFSNLLFMSWVCPFDRPHPPPPPISG